MDRKELEDRIDTADRWTLRLMVLGELVFIASLIPMKWEATWVTWPLLLLALGIMGLGLAMLAWSMMLESRYWAEREKEFRRTMERR